MAISQKRRTWYKHRNTRDDIRRLQEIAEIVSSPLAEFDHINDLDKIAMVMQYDKYPIFRREIIQSIKVTGLWWLDEEQWAQYMWNGHGNPYVLKDEYETDRVLISRTFSKVSGQKTYLWVRKMDDRYDLEGMTHKEGGWEWTTVSVTPAEYARIDSFLGTPYDGCRHNEEDLYVNRK